MLTNQLRLRRQSHPPREFDGTETIYAAADGTLKHMDPDGTVADLVSGDGGSQADGVLAPEWVFTEEAANGPTLPITAVDQGGQTFTVAGDHTARFPVDPANNFGIPFVVDGSTGNDGIYTVNSVSLDGGDTLVSTIEAIPDTTVDGDVIAPRLYRATLDLAEGTVVDDVRLHNLSDGGAWAADVAKAYIYDSLGGYIVALGLDLNTGTFANTYDPVSSVDDSTVISLAVRQRNSSFAHPWEGTLATVDNLSVLADKQIHDHDDAIQHALGWAKGGGGRRYLSDDTLILLVCAASATPPVSPTGVLVAKVVYSAPTATAVAGS